MPTKIFDLELTGEISTVWGLEDYDSVQILARYHNRPVGWMYFSSNYQPAISAERLRQAITDQLSWELTFTALKQQFGTDNYFPSEPISVVVCTHQSSSHLKHCLQSLLKLDYPSYEVIVVDNTPQSEETARLVADFPVRYIREDCPSLSWARNRGISEARYDIITFIEQDAVADPFWLKAIAHNFSDPEVMAVTGLAIPSKVKTATQLAYELNYGGLDQSLHRQTITKKFLSQQRGGFWKFMPDRDLLRTNRFGNGTNMAFRRTLFDRVGLFDLTLGAISHQTSSNFEMLHRLVSRGETLVYDPSALVWQISVRNQSTLRQQAYDIGCSLGTYLITCAHQRSVSLVAIWYFVIYDWLWRSILHRIIRPRQLPRYLLLLEFLGMVKSPLTYRKASALAKWMAKTHPETETQQADSQKVML